MKARTFSLRLTIACAVLPTLLGLLVLFGWYSHNVTLVQVLPTFVPMQYNTALGFALCGAGLLAALRGLPVAARVLGLLAAAIGVLTLTEYLFGLDLGIDQALMEHYITVETSNPGRMAPNTALCFTLTGIALAVADPSRPWRWAWIAAAMLGSLVVGLGIVSLTGYATGLEAAYGWAKLTRMAVHTAVGFMLLGVGLLSFTWHERPGQGSEIPNWLPLPAGILVLTITLSLAQALDVAPDTAVAEYLIIVFGLGLAIAFTIVIKFAQVSRGKALEVRRLSKVFMDAADPILIENLDGIVIDMNAEAERAYGWSREELIGRSIDVIVPTERHDQAHDLLVRCKRGEDVRNIEGLRQDKNGEIIPVLLTLSLLQNEMGEPEAVATLAKDIRALKEARERLEKYSEELEEEVRERTRELSVAKESAEEATRAKSAFLATMSHEIRTPMNGVVGMIDLLRRTKLDEDQRDMVGTIKESAFSLLTIIDDILDFSKIEAGKLLLESIPVSVRDVVEGVAQNLATNSSRKGIGLLTYVDPEIPEALLGDPVRLRQILVNLGGNAVKFTEEGKVTIRAELVEPDREDKLCVRFSVTDTGIGISEEDQSKLFEAFTQAEESTTRRFGGTGLGLTICNRLMELMGGTMGLQSELGAGSVFTVTIPYERSEEVAGEGKRDDLADLHVLLAVEDDDIRAFTRQYLKYWKARVGTVERIDAALPRARETASAGEAFDIVVLEAAGDAEGPPAVHRSFADDPGLSGTRFVILEGGSRRSARIESPDTITVDTHPLTRTRFLKAVAVAAGRASPEIKREEEVLEVGDVRAPTIEEAVARGELILVAEDNVINQNVILRQLNMLGYAAEMADDGAEALEALHRKPYALLLTDCHMPNMDGFDLTAAIRREEQAGDSHLPIIAITANALQGEAERCLAAGMDGYLSKPLEMTRLKHALRQWMPSAAPAPADAGDVETEVAAAAASEAVSAGAAAVDPAALEPLTGGDRDVLKEILGDFVDPAQSIAGEIEAAYAERSAPGVGAAAHKFKSAAQTIGAKSLADLCIALESAGKAGNWEEIDALAPRLDGELRQVLDYIAAL